ncbi:YfcE family phosphodiesterase [uncultured Ilyobacter sp.]|jgi:hypothetical protein|uniref:YfcE family phosphodiesterase n=1 Tax=uncultured Ilyobacter sp. TaxID=544433 RepID=UPI0029C02782|nr:YfcE family phosphodiesterase [uncultured Ilyobacter sp.]
MKILVVSDSHQHLEKLIDMFEKENPDIVISAGDNSGDAIDLSYIKEEADYYIVRGNCDYFDFKTDDTEEFNIKGKKIFLTHGHLYNVKSGYEKIKIEAVKKQADIVIFGHTHIPYVDAEYPVLFNPGAAKDGKYGTIEISGEEIKFYHKKL